MFKRIAFLAVFTLLFGCAQTPDVPSSEMGKPIVFEGSSEFYRILQALENQISPDEYQALTDAIGNLKAHDLENVSYEDFHASLDGLSPNQIIEKAARVCDRVGC